MDTHSSYQLVVTMLEVSEHEQVVVTYARGGHSLQVSAISYQLVVTMLEVSEHEQAVVAHA